MAELTAEMVVDQLVPSDPRISPDGTLVAFVVAPMGRRGEHPEAAVWLVPSNGSERARKLTSGAVNDRSPRWSPDGRWLYFLSDRSERGEAQLYRMPAQKSGEAEALTGWKAGIESFVPVPDGESVAFLAKDEADEEDERRERERDDAEVFGERWPYARLRLLEIGTGKVRTVEALGERHVVEVAPHPSGTSLAVVSWPTPELDNWSRENAVHEVSIPDLETRRAVMLGAGVYELAWGKATPAGPRLFAVAAGPGGVGEAMLHEIPLEPGGNGPRMLEGDLPACPAGVRRGGAPEADPLVTVADGLDTWVGRLWTEEATLKELSRHSGLLHSLDSDAGGKTVAALRSTSEEPLEVWAGPPEGPLRRLTDLNPGLREAAFGRQERLSWRAPDGLRLDGLLILPPGETHEGGPFPLVTLVHGGPYDRWADCLHLNWAFSGRWLADGGYATFLPNPRGGQGHGRRFAASVAGAVGTGDYSDVISGLERLVDEGVADPDRLGIGGWSQGGYMAAWAVGQTERFKAAVMGAGISDQGGMVAEGDIPTFELALGGSAGWEGPGPHHHDGLSPISHAHRVSTPVLILHGEKDERVPLGQARYFARALRAHGCPFEFVVYPREPHVLQERNHQLDVLRRARAWFDRWLANDGHAADQAGGYGR